MVKAVMFVPKSVISRTNGPIERPARKYPSPARSGPLARPRRETSPIPMTAAR